MISNSDKGGVTIISNKKDYYDKMRALISDLDSFTPLDIDPTERMEGRVNRFLDKLYHANYISDSVKKNMKTWTTIPPRLFGQIKYHKAGNPIRLIVSTINTAAYKMARFLATILRKSFKSKYGVKNAQHFIKLIRKQNITRGNVLVSYDVVNCFGNIPTNKALELIERDFHLIEQQTPIPKKEFLTMLKICLQEANYFAFSGKFYRQTKGMFMGSSLAPILVERVIEDIVDKTIQEMGLAPDFWSTYVDDHITSVPENMPEQILNKLNSFDEDVQFTMVTQDQQNKSIEFLDLTVYNKGEKLITKWYHKPIASNRILNFYSGHPKNMVMNVAKSFVRRVFTLSHRTFNEDNRRKIKEILTKNNFPAKTIENVIQQIWNSPRRNNSQQPPSNEISYPFLNDTTIGLNTTTDLANTTIVNHQPTNQQERKKYAGMSYVPGLSEQISKKLKEFAPNLTIAPRPPEKVSKLFSDMKQKLSPGQCSCVVYGIPCGNCPLWYFGETTWSVNNRCKLGHQKDLRNIKSKPKATALVHHTNTTKHQFNFDGKKVMKNVRSRRTLKIHEANQIIMNEHKAVNFKKDSEHVSPEFYNLIIKNMKTRIVHQRNKMQQVNLSTLFDDDT